MKSIKKLTSILFLLLLAFFQGFSQFNPEKSDTAIKNQKKKFKRILERHTEYFVTGKKSEKYETRHERIFDSLGNLVTLKISSEEKGKWVVWETTTYRRYSGGSVIASYKSGVFERVYDSVCYDNRGREVYEFQRKAFLDKKRKWITDSTLTVYLPLENGAILDDTASRRMLYYDNKNSLVKIKREFSSDSLVIFYDSLNRKVERWLTIDNSTHIKSIDEETVYMNGLKILWRGYEPQPVFYQGINTEIRYYYDERKRLIFKKIITRGRKTDVETFDYNEDGQLSSHIIYRDLNKLVKLYEYFKN